MYEIKCMTDIHWIILVGGPTNILTLIILLVKTFLFVKHIPFILLFIYYQKNYLRKTNTNKSVLNYLALGTQGEGTFKKKVSYNNKIITCILNSLFF